MKLIRRTNVDDSHLKEYVQDPIIRQILARRGIQSQSDILCNLSDIHHFKDLHDIDKASSLLAEAIEHKHPILVAGDYDVDGITGTALGVRGLKDLGAESVSHYAPSRYEAAHAVSPNAVNKASARAAK